MTVKLDALFIVTITFVINERGFRLTGLSTFHLDSMWFQRKAGQHSRPEVLPVLTDSLAQRKGQSGAPPGMCGDKQRVWHDTLKPILLTWLDNGLQ